MDLREHPKSSKSVRLARANKDPCVDLRAAARPNTFIRISWKSGRLVINSNRTFVHLDYLIEVQNVTGEGEKIKDYRNYIDNAAAKNHQTILGHSKPFSKQTLPFFREIFLFTIIVGSLLSFASLILTYKTDRSLNNLNQ